MKIVYVVITTERWNDEDIDHIEVFEDFNRAKIYFENEIKLLSSPNKLISKLNEMGCDYMINYNRNKCTFSVYEKTGKYNAYIYINENVLK